VPTVFFRSLFPLLIFPKKQDIATVSQLSSYIFPTMKFLNTKILSIAAIITAILALLGSAVNARHYTSVIAPRSYQFHRSFRDPFDLVSEMIQAPIYFNSRMRQQQQEAAQLARSTPRYTVSEENGVVQLEMEVPGVTANDIEIALEDNQLLRVKGKRKRSARTGSLEESEFDLAFRLNDGVDPSQLKAVLSAGILQVRVPHKEKEIQRIAISTVDADEVDVVNVNVNHVNENGTDGATSDTVEVNEITISENE
jgi:HSP20 family molecular chaperone IbpA